MTQAGSIINKGPGRPRDEEVRRRILKSAAQLLEAKAFDDITVDAIAEHASSCKATVYRWWPNKAAVLIEAFRENIAVALPSPDSGDFREDVRQQLRSFTKIILGGGGRIFAGFLAEAQSEPDVAEAFREAWIRPRRTEAKKLFARYVELGIARPDLDLDLAVEILFAPLYYRLLTGWGKITDAYLEGLIDTALHGLLRREEDSK
jgi:AcrR family transcriptional regulator